VVEAGVRKACGGARGMLRRGDAARCARVRAGSDIHHVDPQAVEARQNERRIRVVYITGMAQRSVADGERVMYAMRAARAQ